MKIEFDPEKNARNLKKHGMRFEEVGLLDWDNAYFTVDDRQAYGETRFVVFAMMKERLCVVCLTPRRDHYRILSFRKANKREQEHHAKKTTDR